MANSNINDPPLQYPSITGKVDFSVDEAIRIAYANLTFLRGQVAVLNSLVQTSQRQVQEISQQVTINATSSSSTAPSSSMIVDTHTFRITIAPASGQPVGQEFFETDRAVMYVVSNSSGINRWVYTGGVMYAALASIPTDLTTDDTGFQFVNSDIDTNSLYVWTGTEFITVDYLQSILDTTNNALTTVQILEHLVAGAGAANMGVRQLHRLRDDASATVNASAINTETTVAAAATYTTKWTVQLRNAGAALADWFQVQVASIRFKVGGFFGIFTHANAADRTYTLPDATGNITYETAALTNNNFLFGGGGALVKDAGFASPLPIANGGTGSTVGFEYGSWTPTISFGGGSTGVTYSVQVGTYEKITSSAGVWVRAHCYMVLTSKGSSTGDVLIGGLPFTIQNTTNQYPAHTSWAQNLASITGHLQGYGNINTTNMTLSQLGTGTLTALNDTNFANDSQIMISINYKVS